MNNSNDQLFQVYWDLYEKYWPDNLPAHLGETMCAKNAFHLQLVTERTPRDATVCDLGGGWGLFSAGCAKLGMNSIMIDDYMDAGFFDDDDPRQRLLEECSVQAVRRDVIKDGIRFDDESIDVFTSFDSMEHWHNSPKTLFAQVRTALKPGGLFVLGVPNNVNLRKRVTVPLGRGDWSHMNHWYEPEQFRGHVREPCVRDLRYIANDMRLTNVEILGRNWPGYENPRASIRALMPLIDMTIRWRPSLCGTIYLVARKPD